jgi:endoglucanase
MTRISAASGLIILVVVIFAVSQHNIATKKSDALEGSGNATTPLAASSSAPVASTAPSVSIVYPGGLFVNPNGSAAHQAASLAASGDTTRAALVDQISSQPAAIWLGSALTVADLGPLLSGYREQAKQAGTTLVFVTSAVPDRDCDGPPADGEEAAGLDAAGLSAHEYSAWNRAIASDLAGSGAVVLVEPGSLEQLSTSACVGDSAARLAAIKGAVDTFIAAHLTVYADGGSSSGVEPSVMADRLEAVDVADARGFTTNVAGYNRVDAEREYADSLSALLGNKHYVIDVSRSGNGSQGTGCNAAGAVLGQNPRVEPATTALDALLWIKNPGDSDGTCNGGPPAGHWWQSAALALVNGRGE